MKPIYKLAALVASGTFVALTAGEAASDQTLDYVPFLKGPATVSADNGHTNTYQYWKDAEAVRKHSSWIGDPKNEWKLNWKFRNPDFDDSLHGGYFALDRGEELYSDLNKDGSFAACIGAKDGNLKGLRANHYPHYDTSLGRVVGLEFMIEKCAGEKGKKLVDGSYDNSSISIYVSSFSNGMPVNVDVSSGPMKKAFERGKKTFHRKAGASNFACASCHVSMVGKFLRGQHLTTPYGDTTHFPTWRTKDEVQSLQVRFTECNRNAGVQPLKIGSKTYADLELYMTALSNGYPIAVPSQRD